MAVAESGGACCSSLHELSTSPGSFLGCWSTAIIGLFSSSMLLRSDGVDSLDDDTVGGNATETSSENIDMSCSSSSRSKPLVPCITDGVEFRHSSMNAGVSRKVTESLIDRLWAPRREEEKSRNSSIQEGCTCWAVAVATFVEALSLVVAFVGRKFAITGILW